MNFIRQCLISAALICSLNLSYASQNTVSLKNQDNIPLSYGQIVKLENNTLIVGGRHPSSVLLEPDVPNIVLHKANDTLYIIDTGVGEYFRHKILEAISRLRPFNKVIILNSHYHPDHTSNNGILEDIQANDKQLVAPSFTIKWHDAKPIFRQFYQSYADNFTLFGDLKANNDIVKKFISKQFQENVNTTKLIEFNKLSNELHLPKIINHFTPQFMNDYVLSNFIDYKSATNNQATPLEQKPLSNLTILGTTWKGWRFSDDVYVLQVQGHSPDGVIFYFPKIHYLHVSDETSSTPIWPDTNVKNAINAIGKYQLLANKDAIRYFSDGHHDQIYVGKANINTFLNNLLVMNKEFTQAVTDILPDSKEGLTIDEMYRQFAMNAPPSLQALFNNQFPIFAIFIKGYLLNELTHRHTSYTGEGVNRRYYKL